jgi:hypothetical protein
MHNALFDTYKYKLPALKWLYSFTATVVQLPCICYQAVLLHALLAAAMLKSIAGACVNTCGGYLSATEEAI